jgi:hypothetical protein
VFTKAGLLIQPNSVQQILEPRIGAQRIINGIYFEGGETGMLRVSLFQPDEGLFLVAHADSFKSSLICPFAHAQIPTERNYTFRIRKPSNRGSASNR